MTVILAAILLVSAVLALGVTVGLRRLVVLAELPLERQEGTSVSVVVAARDEAAGIEAAARSLLALAHRPLEIVLVDDRSTDGTGAILDRLAGRDPRVRVLHLRELPPGWLGKNHALARGAELASGEWLLFTDADIVMAPDTVDRALGYSRRRGLDHLTMVPETRATGLWLQAFITGFTVFGLVASRAWSVRNPKSRASLGLGAFNLVRASAYRRAGGLETIRLRPDDDLKLGKILKRSGARSDVVRGRGAAWVEWYPTLRRAVDGLMKNTFAVVEYRVLPILAGALFYLAMGIGPLAGLLLGNPVERVLAAMALGFQLVAAWAMSRDIPTPRYSALLFPVACLVLCWVVLRAMVLAFVRGGIVWRGTFYSLAELKKNRV